MAQAMPAYSPMDAKKPRTQSSEDQSLAGQLLEQWQYLYGLRGNWMAHWTEIAQRVKPDDSWLFQNYAQLTMQGDKRNMELFDSTALAALNKFGSIMDSLLTPQNSIWQRLASDNPTIMRNKACRLWFDEATQILFRRRYASTANFASENNKYFLSLGAYGTGATFIDALAGQPGLRYLNTHLSEIYLQENHQRLVDQVCRKFMLTARQAYLQFGDTCPEQVLTKLSTAPESQFFFLHWVKPRDDWEPDRKDGKGKRFASYYVSVEGSSIVWDPRRDKDQGYRMFPYAIGRYRQAANEAYGRSPAMDCLPAIKTLNEQKKTMLKQGHRIVDPVLLAHDDGIVDSFNMQPGSITGGGVSADGRPLIQALPTGNVQAGKELMEEEQSLINDSFLVKVFQILQETPEMTATEVMERVREKGILLNPTAGRQQSEYLGPMTEREIDVLSSQGLLPKMPPLLASAKGEYKIVYDSPMSRTQRAEYASGAMRAMEIFAQYAQQTGDRSTLNVINIDKAGPEIADIYGVPAHWINDPQQIQALKKQQQAQAAMQATNQAGPAHAALLKAHIAGGGALPGTPQAAAQDQAPGMMPQALRRRRARGPLGQ